MRFDGGRAAVATLAVAMGPFHGEGVRQMAHLANRSIVQEDFDDVEADFHFGMLNGAQVIERGVGHALASFPINGSGRAHPIFRRAGFHFNKYQAVVFPKDEIQFSAGSAVIGREKFKSAFSKMLFSCEFAEFTKAQVIGPLVFCEPALDARA